MMCPKKHGLCPAGKCAMRSEGKCCDFTCVAVGAGKKGKKGQKELDKNELQQKMLEASRLRKEAAKKAQEDKKKKGKDPNDKEDGKKSKDGPKDDNRGIQNSTCLAKDAKWQPGKFNEK